MLAIAAGLVLVLVIAHSTWTSRQSQPKQADPLLSQEELAALEAVPMGDSDHRDPVMGSDMPGEVAARDVSSQLDALCKHHNDFIMIFNPI